MKRIKLINNNAERQQRNGKLTPYMLYIEIVFSKEEVEEILKRGKINKIHPR